MCADLERPTTTSDSDAAYSVIFDWYGHRALVVCIGQATRGGVSAGGRAGWGREGRGEGVGTPRNSGASRWEEGCLGMLRRAQQDA